MSEITLKAIEQLLDKNLAQKFDEKLKPIRAGMAHLATQQSLNDMANRLITIEGILNQHSTALDAVSVDVKDWNAEMTLMRNRMDRYENALKLVGQKLNLDLKTLLG